MTELNRKHNLAFSGVLAPLSIGLGYIWLTTVNPQILIEFNNIPITSYNIYEMNGRYIAIITLYLIPGIAASAYLIELIVLSPKNSQFIVGAIFLFTAFAIWISFGFISHRVGNYNSHLWNTMARTGLFNVCVMIGLFLISTELKRTKKRRYISLLAILFSCIIIIIGGLNFFIIEDAAWYRTNILVLLPFLWIGVFGLVNFNWKLNES